MVLQVVQNQGLRKGLWRRGRVSSWAAPPPMDSAMP